jgi:hypothetical protein
MTAPAKLNFKVYQGSTFRETLRWESAVKVYVPITNITKTAPMVVSADNHQLPVGWRTKIVGATGMKQISSDEYFVATGVTNNTVTFNDINALAYSTYTGGGVLEYNQAIDLAGYTARMQIREKLDSVTAVHELTTENSGVVINNTEKTIRLFINSTTTAGFSFQSGVYSLELVNGSGDVTQLISGNISLVKEVTR